MAHLVKLSDQRWINLDQVLTVFDNTGLVRVMMVGDREVIVRGPDAEKLLTHLRLVQHEVGR